MLDNEDNKTKKDPSIQDYANIEELPPDILMELTATAVTGVYVIGNDGKLIRLQPQDLKDIDIENTRLIKVEQVKGKNEVAITYGFVDVWQEIVNDPITLDKQIMFHVEFNDDGVMYDNYGTKIFKGEFRNDERYIGIAYQRGAKPTIQKFKYDESMEKHDNHEALIYFAHNMSRRAGDGAESDALNRYNALADKYNNMFLYDFTKAKDDKEYEYKAYEGTAYTVRGKVFEDTKVFNFVLDAHGVENITHNYIHNNGEVFTFDDSYKNARDVRMKAIADAIIHNVMSSKHDPIIVRLKLNQCYGALIGKDKENLLTLLTTNLRSSGKNIDLYIERTQEGEETYMYQRRYKNGFYGYGTTSAKPREYKRYHFSADGKIDEYTFQSKKEYREVLEQEKNALGLKKQQIVLTKEQQKEANDAKKSTLLVDNNDSDKAFRIYSEKRKNSALENAKKKQLDDILAQKVRYKRNKVDMSKFKISTCDRIIIICLCVLFPLAIMYYDQLKKEFIEEQKREMKRIELKQERKIFEKNKQKIDNSENISGLNNSRNANNSLSNPK